MTITVSMKVTNLSRGGEITGATGMLHRRTDLRVVQAKPGVTVGQLTEAMKGNRLDEVVVRGPGDRLYVVFADELRGQVDKGERLQIGDLVGEVVAVDNELNQGWVRAAKVAGIGVAAAIAGLIGGGFLGGALAPAGDGFLGIARVLGSMMVGGAGGATAGVAAGIHATRNLAAVDRGTLERLTEPVPEGALSLLELRAGRARRAPPRAGASRTSSDSVR